MIQEQEAELSLADIWATVKRYKRIILLFPIICGIAAYILVAFIIAPKWEATAILQVGQIKQDESAKQVEPVGNVIARMQHPSFAMHVTKQTAINSEQLPMMESIYRDSLKVRKVKDADLIEFSVRGFSPEMARDLAAASVGYLRQVHDEMMSPGVVRIRAQIQAVNEGIQAAKADELLLKKQLQGAHNWNSYNATLAATVLQDKTNQLRDLAQKKLQLAEALSPSMTFTTKVVGDITVSEEPVSPRKPMIIALSLLAGLFGGLFIAFVLNAVSKAR